MDRLSVILGQLERQLGRLSASLEFDMDAIADYVIVMVGDDLDDATNEQNSTILIRQFWGQIRDHKDEFFKTIRVKMQGRPKRLSDSIKKAVVAVTNTPPS